MYREVGLLMTFRSRRELVGHLYFESDLLGLQFKGCWYFDVEIFGRIL
jgi:hypothetical protein